MLLNESKLNIDQLWVSVILKWTVLSHLNSSNHALQDNGIEFLKFGCYCLNGDQHIPHLWLWRDRKSSWHWDGGMKVSMQKFTGKVLSLQNRLFPFLLSPYCKWWLFHGQKQLWGGCWGWFKGNSLCLDWSRGLEPTKVSISPFTSICDVSPWGLRNLTQMLVCACFRCPCGWGLGRQHGALVSQMGQVHPIKV